MYSETFLARANCAAGSFSPEIDSSASGKHKGGGVPRAGDPDWSLPPNVSEHNSRNWLSAVWPRLAATCHFLELCSQGVANRRGRQPPLSGGRCRPASPARGIPRAAEPAGALHLSEREMRRYCRRPNGTGCPLEVRYRAGRENTIDGF